MSTFIKEAPLEVFLGIIGLFLVMAGALIALGVKARKKAQLIKNTPVVKISDVTEGLAALEGKAANISTATVAPLSKTPCCWYRIKVEELTKRDTNSTTNSSQWTTIKDETSSTPFLFKSGFDAAIVLPFNADITPSDIAVWYGSSPEPDTKPTKRVPPGEAPEGIFRMANSITQRYRYREERVLNDSALYALGTIQPIDSDAIDPDDLEDEYDKCIFEGLKVSSKTLSQCIALSAVSRNKLLDIQSKGMAAMLFVSLVPLSIFAFVLWARFQ